MGKFLGHSMWRIRRDRYLYCVFIVFFILPNTPGKSPNTLSNSYCNVWVVRKVSPNTRSDFAEYTLRPPNTRFYHRIHQLGSQNTAEYTYLGAEYTEEIAEYTEIRPNTRRCIRPRPRRIHGETIFFEFQSFGVGETHVSCIRRRRIHHFRTHRVCPVGAAVEGTPCVLWA